jgi:gamma-butyrobetaine dioxygenase
MDGPGSRRAALARFERSQGKLEVVWDDGARSTFHDIWLRDNCRCADCGEPEIGRRTLRLTDIPMDISVSDAAIDADGGLAIRWSDGHESRFASEWLRAHAYDVEARSRRAFVPPLWADDTRANPPSMAFGEVRDDEAAFLRMLMHVRDSGLCFLRGAPGEPGTVEPLARRIGPLQESNFGRVQDVLVDPSRRSVAQSTIALKPHTDEPYRASPPGVLIFHCVETDVTGAGSSLFMDGFEIAETLRREDPVGFAALTRNKQPFRRHRVAAPLSIAAEDVAAYYRGLRRLLELAEDPDRMIRLTLRPGDVALFDNHRVLHGRTAITTKGRRWLQWLQIERGDFHSALRVTADRLQRTRDAAPLLRGAYG